MGAEVTEICRGLIRLDTTDIGGFGGANERPAAGHIADQLRDMEWPSKSSRQLRNAPVLYVDSLAPTKLLRESWPIPVAEGERSVNPFDREMRYDAVCGRGAIYMKNGAPSDRRSPVRLLVVVDRRDVKGCSSGSRTRRQAVNGGPGDSL